MSLRHVDLCAGTGAFTLAFENTGKVKCVYANDFSKFSKKIYEANFDSHVLDDRDLCNIDVSEIPRHDILTAGFPCQPFSVAGARKGFEDSRSNVFWKIIEIVDFHNPRCVVLENVKNLTTHDNGKTFSVIANSFLDRGYYVEYGVLDTSKITHVPQHRERIYIVCWKGVRPSNVLKFENSSSNDPVSNFLEKDVSLKYYYSTPWSNQVEKEGVVYQYRRVYVRENKKGLCPTLTANMGSGGHNVPLIRDSNGVRKLTPRECFNLQGFPKEYVLPAEISDAQLYKLAGNAVSFPVVNKIANYLLEKMPWNEPS